MVKSEYSGKSGCARSSPGEGERKGSDNARVRLLCQRDRQHVRIETCACESRGIPIAAQIRRILRDGVTIEQLYAQVECTVDARPRPHVWIVRRARCRVAGGALNTIEQEQEAQQREGRNAWGVIRGEGGECMWYRQDRAIVAAAARRTKPDVTVLG